MLFWSLFFKTNKKLLLTAKMAILLVNNFFWCVFKNTDQKDNCASIVFKAESRHDMKKNFCWRGFLQKPKKHFSGVQNGTF